jgi:hypothetical protein
MWTYFFELDGPNAQHTLERIALDLASQGAISQDVLRSVDQPDLYLLHCTVPHALNSTPKEPTVWVFRNANNVRQN